MISESEANHIGKISHFLRIITIVVAISSVLFGIIKSSKLSTLLLVSLLNLLNYVKYLSINYPPRVERMLKEEDIWSFLRSLLPSISFETAIQFGQYPLPINFSQYGLYSSFIMSYWPYLSALALILLTLVLSFVLIRFTKKDTRLNKICTKTKAALRWNFSLAFFVTCYSDIVFYSSFELRTMVYGRSGAAILSPIVCFIVNILTVVAFIRLLSILFAIRKQLPPALIAKDKNMKKDKVMLMDETNKVYAKFRKYKVVFHDFKPTSLVQQAFLPIFIIRVYLFSLTVAYLFEYPLLQTIFFNILNMLMVMYNFIFMPWKARKEQAQYIIQESTFLLISLCVFVLAAMDHYGIKNYERRALLGDIIIWSCVTFTVMSIIYSLWKTMGELRSKYMKYRSQHKSQRQVGVELLKQSDMVSLSPISNIASAESMIIDQTNKKSHAKRNFMQSRIALGLSESSELSRSNNDDKRLMLPARPAASRFRTIISPGANQDSSILLKSMEATSEDPKVDVQPNLSGKRKSLHELSPCSKIETAIHLNIDQESNRTANGIRTIFKTNKFDLKIKKMIETRSKHKSMKKEKGDVKERGLVKT